MVSYRYLQRKRLIGAAFPSGTVVYRAPAGRPGGICFGMMRGACACANAGDNRAFRITCRIFRRWCRRHAIDFWGILKEAV